MSNIKIKLEESLYAQVVSIPNKIMVQKWGKRKDLKENNCFKYSMQD